MNLRVNVSVGEISIVSLRLAPDKVICFDRYTSSWELIVQTTPADGGKTVLRIRCEMPRGETSGPLVDVMCRFSQEVP